jgi:Flp pilus assembly protein TadG
MPSTLPVITLQTDQDRPSSRRGRRGQSLVEFALILPLFVVMLLSIIEFTFVFNALLAVNFASRDAALAAAEAGTMSGSDCVILKAVDAAIGPPTSDARVVSVTVYKTTPSGAQQGGATVYTRDNGVNNTSICAPIDNTVLHYTRSSNGYPEATRCNILAGCDPNVVNDTVDNIAVRVTYRHTYVTPFRNFIGGSEGTLTFDRESVMRMEPVL